MSRDQNKYYVNKLSALIKFIVMWEVSRRPTKQLPLRQLSITEPLAMYNIQIIAVKLQESPL